MANAMRYSYLRGPGGRFRNPYDHGIKKNCSDFLINGYNEDVECIEEPVHSEGITMMNIARNSNFTNGDSHPQCAHGNGHVVIDVNSNSTNPKPPHSNHDNGHVYSAHCSHSNHGKTRNNVKSQNDSVPLGLGLGLGLGPSNRSVAPPS